MKNNFWSFSIKLIARNKNLEIRRQSQSHQEIKLALRTRACVLKNKKIKIIIMKRNKIKRSFTVIM